MAMQWLRKNKKTIMVIVAVPIMVIFLIDFSSLKRNRSGRNEAYGSVTYPDGMQANIMTSEIGMSDRMLRALEEIGVGRLSQMGALSQIKELGGAGQVPAMLAHVLVFGDSYMLAQMRPVLYQMASGWAGDDEEFKNITAEIDSIANTDPADSRLWFLLLAKEAHRAGVFASETQISSVLGLCGQYASQLGNPDLGTILNRYGLTESEFRQAIGNLLSIVLYADSVTDAGVVNENEIRQQVRESLGENKVTGSYVTFRDSYFSSKIGQPTDDDIQKMFDQYKTWLQGQNLGEAARDKNPFRFGYKLADRVQLDIISFDILEAEKVVMAEFDAKPFTVQEDELQNYWKDHKTDFPVRAQPQEEKAEPKYMAFDEAYDQVKRAWLRKLAVDMTERVSAEAARLLQSSPVKPADYKAIAEKVSSGKVKVDYARTDFLSYQKIAEYGQGKLSRARVPRSETAGDNLVSLLYTSEPLRDKPAGRLDNPPLTLMEDITTAKSLDYSNQPDMIYFVRLVAADKEREPVSVADDGRQGGKDAVPLSDGKNDLKDAIVQDWKKMKAFEMAGEQAAGFATEAAANWDEALKKVNAQLKTDPNSTWDMLQVQNLEEERQMMDNYRAQMENNQNRQAASYYGRIIGQIRGLLTNCAKVYRENDGKPQTALLTYKNYEETSCLVFKELKMEPINKDQYLARKAQASHALLGDMQGRLALVHFRPENIKARSGWQDLLKKEKEESESKSEPVPIMPSDNVPVDVN